MDCWNVHSHSYTTTIAEFFSLEWTLHVVRFRYFFLAPLNNPTKLLRDPFIHLEHKSRKKVSEKMKNREKFYFFHHIMEDCNVMYYTM